MAELTPIRSGWNESLMILKGPLTDRAIARYQKLGWYSEEMRAARRKRQDEKAAKRKARMKRVGNFLIDALGNQVYSPI
jgi:hypothetical protein